MRANLSTRDGTLRHSASHPALHACLSKAHTYIHPRVRFRWECLYLILTHRVSDQKFVACKGLPLEM
jgi:hypothetical protein